jgi:hypothetical protein
MPQPASHEELSAAEDQAPAWPRRPAFAQAAAAMAAPALAAGAGEAATGPAPDYQATGYETTGEAAAQDPVAGAWPDREAGRSHMTARGAMVAMFGLFLAGDLIASWTGHEVPAGVGFLAACVLGPYLVRKHALLQVIAGSPALFLVALVITQIATAQGTGKHGKILSVLEGTVLVLAALAPWLLSGTVLGVVVAIPRGLVQCTRDLKRELREDLASRRPWAPRPRRG